MVKLTITYLSCEFGVVAKLMLGRMEQGDNKWGTQHSLHSHPGIASVQGGGGLRGRLEVPALVRVVEVMEASAGGG